MSKFKVFPTEQAPLVEDEFNTIQTQNPKDGEDLLNQGQLQELYDQYDYDFKHIEDILMEGKPGYVPPQNRIRTGKNDKGETMTITIVKAALAEDLQAMLEHATYMEEVVKTDDEITLEILQKFTSMIISVSAKRGELTEITELNKKITRSRTIVQNYEKVALKQSAKQQNKRNSQIHSAKKAMHIQSVVEQNENEVINRGKIAQYLMRRAGDTLKARQVYMMMNFNDLARQRWDMFMIIISVWNAFYIPFLLTFNPSEIYFLEIIMSIMHLSLLLDVIINFRTSYLTFDGQNVQNWEEIAIKYIFKGWFIFDLASGFPFNIISYFVNVDLSWFELLAMTKILRANRLDSITASYSQETRATFKVGKLLVQLLIYVHWISCGWYLACKYNGVWIPPFDEDSKQTDFYTGHAISEQYFQSLHSSVMFLTGTDVHPMSQSEFIFATSLILLAYLFNGQIFAEMAVLVEAMNHKEKLRLQHIDDISKCIDKINLTRDLSKDIRDYIWGTQVKQDLQVEMNNFIDMIGPHLKLKVAWHIFNKIFSINPVLIEMVKRQPASMLAEVGDGQGSDIVSLFVRRLLIQLNNPEEILFQQGWPSTELFFIANGTVSLIYQDSVKDQFVNFRNLQTGDHFGEIGIVYKCPRTASAVTTDYCTLARLPIQNYERLIGEIPEFQTELKNYILSRQNNDPVKEWAFTVMKQIPFLQDIEPDQEWILFHNIFYSMKRRIIPQGELLCKPGFEMRNLIIIQDGVLDVFTHFDKFEGDFMLENLMRGSILFYRTFFIEEPAQVFMRAAQTLTLLEIGIQDLKKFERDCPIFERKLLSHQMKILNCGKQYPLDYMRRLHPDFITPNQKMTLPEVNDRANLMRLLVMRRITEIRQERAKPRLTQLLQQLRNGSIQKKVLMRKHIQDLYEYEPKERQALDKKQWDEVKARYTRPGEEKQTNKTYIELRIKLRKALDEVTQQEEMLDDIREGMYEVLKREGITV